jgi:hypothetical protein
MLAAQDGIDRNTALAVGAMAGGALAGFRRGLALAGRPWAECEQEKEKDAGHAGILAVGTPA